MIVGVGICRVVCVSMRMLVCCVCVCMCVCVCVCVCKRVYVRDRVRDIIIIDEGKK